MRLQLIPAHLNPAEPLEAILRKKALLDRHGLVAYAAVVSHTSTDSKVFAADPAAFMEGGKRFFAAHRQPEPE